MCVGDGIVGFTTTESGESLTYKQTMFCQYYIANDGNASQAALEAGYKKENAHQTGCENLKKPIIKEYLQELNAERSRAAGVTAQWIVDQLRDNAVACLQKDADGLPLDTTAGNKSLELLGKTMTMFSDKKELNVGGSFDITWITADEPDDTNTE